MAIELTAVLKRDQTTLLPGAPNAITARLIEEVGFEAAYVTGAGIANTFLGVPDIGLLTLTELASHVSAMREAVHIPLIVDADTGFGNAVSVWWTVRALERAGADAIQIEDQTSPKRCGHFKDTAVIDASEMADKITAACEARRSPNCLIIARTDARAELGIDEACRRANLYRDAGADIAFVEAPQSLAEIEIVAREVPGPKVLNIVRGGVTPELPTERLSELGYTFALFANLALLASIQAMRETLAYLRSNAGSGSESVPGDQPPTATWDERQRLVRKPEFDALAASYGGDAGRARGRFTVDRSRAVNGEGP
jgi:2-methylisocitrate lyase-like PEP mutase family enzyme